MNYNVGDIINGTISNIKSFGIFIKFDDTFGFCHISNCSHKFIKDLNELFIINQQISAKIIEINSVENKINLSIKDCENNNTAKPKKIKEIKSSNHNEKDMLVNSPTFEDMMKAYLKKSDERLDSIGKRNQKHRKR